MEALCSSETSVATQQTTRRHIPEDDILHSIFVFGRSSYGISAEIPAVLTESFRYFPQHHQKNAWVVPRVAKNIVSSFQFPSNSLFASHGNIRRHVVWDTDYC
jgi:hypothetical protein